MPREEVDVLAPKNADFQTVEYWDKRYATEGPQSEFDWFRKVRGAADGSTATFGTSRALTQRHDS